MKLNVLTAKAGVPAEVPIKIPELTFWKHYLHFLNLRSNFYIQQKEQEVFSWILSQDPGTSWFSKPYSDQMKEAIHKLSDAEITRIRKRLMRLGLVEEHSDPNDGRKNITVPVPGLRKLQDIVKSTKEVNLIFPYEIAEQ